jgi:hypothetical protein
MAASSPMSPCIAAFVEEQLATLRLGGRSLCVLVPDRTRSGQIRPAPPGFELVEILIIEMPPYNHEYDADHLPEAGRSRTPSPLSMTCCS